MRISKPLQLLNELRRNSMNAECDQLFQFDVVVAALLELRHPFRRRAMNPHRNQRVLVRFVSGLMKAAYHQRGYSVNSERHQLVALGNVEPLGSKRLDKRHIDSEDTKCDELVCIKPAEMFTLHLPRKFKTYIL